jgi:hypothetical protein
MSTRKDKRLDKIHERLYKLYRLCVIKVAFSFTNDQAYQLESVGGVFLHFVNVDDRVVKCFSFSSKLHTSLFKFDQFR